MTSGFFAILHTSLALMWFYWEHRIIVWKLILTTASTLKS